MTKRAHLTTADRHAAAKIRRILVARFAQCFAPRGQPKWPLKIGIAHDLAQAAPDLDARQIKLALTDYTQGLTYLECLTAGADRLDLSGNPVGKVNALEADLAADRVRRIKANNERQRAAATLERVA